MCINMGVGVGDVCVFESVSVVVLVHYARQIQNKYMNRAKMKIIHKQVFYGRLCCFLAFVFTILMFLSSFMLNSVMYLPQVTISCIHRIGDEVNYIPTTTPTNMRCLHLTSVLCCATMFSYANLTTFQRVILYFLFHYTLIG